MDNFFFLLEMMTSHEFQRFNIILAHAREKAKDEVRSKILIYDQLLKCMLSIYILVVHVVNINTYSFFYQLVIHEAINIPQAH